MIHESSYYGPQVTYTLTLPDGGDLRVTCKPDPRTGPLPLGETVTAAWDASDVWLLPAERDAGQPGPSRTEADADPPLAAVPDAETTITDR